MCVALTLMVSCSADDVFTEEVTPDPVTNAEVKEANALTLLTVDGKPVKNISSEYSEYRLAVSAEGDWAIETNGDFIEVIPSSGSGNDTVVVMVADNWWKERTVRLELKDERRETRVESGEFPLGGSAGNSLGSITTSQEANEMLEKASEHLSAVRGAGYSYMPNTVYCMGTGMEILNMKELESIQKTENVNLLMDDFCPVTQQDVFTSDNIENLNDQLSITATATIKYGLFTLKITGDFEKESTSSVEKEYSIMRLKQCNFTREVNVVNALALIQQNPDYRKRILAPGYRYLLDNFIKDIHNANSDLERYSLCEHFVEQVGPAFVSKAMLGTVMDYYYSIEKSKLSEGMTAGGAVTASFGFVFDISLTGDIHYTEEQQKYANESRKSFKVRGGDISKVSSLTVGDKVPYTQLREWMLSVVPENAALIDMHLSPVYVLVDDVQAHDALVNYMNLIAQ